MKSNECIVFLTPGFPKDEKDVNCIPAMQDFFNAWNRNIKHENIFILTFQYPFKSGWYKWNGINVYSAAGSNRTWFFKIVCWMRILFQLFKLSRNYKIKALFSFWFTETAFVAWLFSFFNSTQLFCYLFGQDALESNKYLKVIPLHKFKVIGNSAFTSNEFFKTTQQETNATIPLGLDVFNISLVQKEMQYDIIGVGSLHAIKNYSLFIEGVSAVKNYYPSIKAIIAGGGNDEAMLRKKIRELNLESNIEMAGEVPRQKVIELLCSSHIMLHTSTYESFCLARLEAFYAGCSVVTFKNGYLIAHEDFIAVDSKEEMIAAVLNLLKNKKTRTIKAVRTMDDCVKDIYTLLQP